MEETEIRECILEDSCLCMGYGGGITVSMRFILISTKGMFHQISDLMQIVHPEYTEMNDYELIT